MCAIIPVCALRAATVGTAHASLSENTIFVDQEFIASEPTLGRDYTGFTFRSASPVSFVFEGSFLDEGVAVYLVEANDVFSAASILGGIHTELSFGAEIMVEPELFLGFRTPSSGEIVGGLEPAYGWVKVMRTRFSGSGLGSGSGQEFRPDLLLIDHAVAYDAKGIIIGTLVSIPEPSSWFLAASGLVGFLGLRRRGK